MTAIASGNALHLLLCAVNADQFTVSVIKNSIMQLPGGIELVVYDCTQFQHTPTPTVPHRWYHISLYFIGKSKIIGTYLPTARQFPGRSVNNITLYEIIVFASFHIGFVGVFQCMDECHKVFFIASRLFKSSNNPSE